MREIKSIPSVNDAKYDNIVNDSNRRNSQPLDLAQEHMRGERDHGSNTRSEKQGGLSDTQNSQQGVERFLSPRLSDHRHAGNGYGPREGSDPPPSYQHSQAAYEKPRFQKGSGMEQPVE